MSEMTTVWFLGMVMGGAMGSAIALETNCALAQSNIVPDNTLGAENSTVIPNYNGQPIEVISGGAIRGQNLFHSFQEFNVSNGRGAYFFSSGANIQNILTRVTGSNPSEILGVLGTFGNSNPNLFLINPNGILFGRNARLNVGGSFVATTANAIQFSNQGFFSATNPNTPELLTINPSAFFFNQIATAPIQNNSQASAGLDPSGTFVASGLRVPDNQSLLLIGGDIAFNGATLNVFGGRVELGGVAGAGTVGLATNGNNLSLAFPEQVERANISLTNGTRVDVVASDGGSIVINARNLDVLQRSTLFAGIARGLGSVGSQTEDITINATEAIRISDRSAIFSRVEPNAVGNSGSINIQTRKLELNNESGLFVATFGLGDAAKILIQVDGSVELANNSQIFSGVERNAVGNSGDIDIKAESLILKQGSQISAGTSGQGDAGNVSISVLNTVSLDGESSNGQFPSGVFSNVGQTGIGNGGDIRITTGSLSVTNSAQISAGTSGQGDAGDVTVRALDAVSLADNALIFSAVEAGGVGKGGNIDINAVTLSLKDGAQLISSTREATYTQPAGRGDAGNVNVNVTGTVDIAGKKNGFRSGIFSRVGTGTVGNGGNITIDSGSFSLRDGAQLSASIGGRGNGGNIIFNIRDFVEIVGTSSDSQFSSGIQAAVEREGVGNAGNLTITTGRLVVRDGAQISAATFGQGDAGSINFNALESVELMGISANGQFPSGLRSAVEQGALGNGGDLTLTTRRLVVRDGAEVTVSNQGIGNAGRIQARIFDIRLDNQGKLTAESVSGKGGDIQLHAENLMLLRRGSLISAISGVPSSNGFDGNINIDTKFLIAVPSENSDIVATGFGRTPGSNIQVNAQGIFGTKFREQLTNESDIVATGQVTLNIPDVDPNRGLVELPTYIIDASQQIDNSCTSGSRHGASSFVITGRGGLPPSPIDMLTPDAIVVDLITLNPSNDNSKSPSAASKPRTAVPEPIIEATGWVKNAKGEVELVANAPTTPHGSWHNPVSCLGS